MSERAGFSTIEQNIRERMKTAKLHEAVTEEFIRRVDMVYKGSTGKIPWNEIQDLRAEDLIDLEALQNTKPKTGEKVDLSGLAVIKLNGGLGTSMGLTKAKTLISVREGKTFLDITLDQMNIMRKDTGASIPLIFMNSFNTSEDTLNHPGVRGFNQNCAGNPPVDFIQNRVPRIDAETLLPVGDGNDPSHWCPPGHGDIFLALWITGILDQLIEAGYSTAFLSNGDNLGAVVDPEILAYFEQEGLEFMSEVTAKTKADIKGGVLFRHQSSNRIALLETAQVEEKHLADFEDISRFSDFNINNIWINLPALKKKIEQKGLLLSMIVNPKEVEGQKVLQLEAAMGSAIGSFDKSRVIRVPRNRFAPVKNNADLLVRRSDACILDNKGALIPSPDRAVAEPFIKLDDAYKKIAGFEKLVQTPPSLVQTESLTVEGPVWFDMKVTISGNVTIRNPGNEPAAISQIGRERIENETITLS